MERNANNKKIKTSTHIFINQANLSNLKKEEKLVMLQNCHKVQTFWEFVDKLQPATPEEIAMVFYLWMEYRLKITLYDSCLTLLNRLADDLEKELRK